MPTTVEPLTRPKTRRKTHSKPQEKFEVPYLVICWNDPVNLMTYVTHVFQKVFGWPRQRAELHMLQVHHEGRSVLAREGLEKAEHYVHQLQSYGLHATMESAK
jgi:ATP-dependent Clp protease adaptor protein ClpS